MNRIGDEARNPVYPVHPCSSFFGFGPVRRSVMRSRIIFVIALLAWLLCGAAQATTVSTRLKIGNGSGWTFQTLVGQTPKLGEKWRENAEGVIAPPAGWNLQSRAFYKPQSFSDLTAEFDFNPSYYQNGCGNAGLVIRAPDPDHFYYVYFPWGGQTLRSKHFFAAVAKVQGDGYLHNIGMVWVPGLASETDRWYHARVEAKGPRISVWVDGRKAISVTDSTYKSGRTGVAGYGQYQFRNVRISGTVQKLTLWKNGKQIPSHSTTLGLSCGAMPTASLAPNGDVLVAGAGIKDGKSTVIRSIDKGRTWDESYNIYVRFPDNSGTPLLGDYGSTMLRTSKGKLIVMVFAEGDSPRIGISESLDHGKTWPVPTESQVSAEWGKLPMVHPYGTLVETADGALTRFFMTAVPWEGGKFDDVSTWGSLHTKAYAMRSADEGRTWSAPIEIDQPSWSNKARGTIPGALDFTEASGVAIGNSIMTLIRPIYSPFMWQCWSHDGGATWDAAARTTFAGSAQSILRLKSGVILCAHRFPGYTVHISRDNGLNWDDGTVIDYPSWAMGNLVEVEPNVVLCTYMSEGDRQKEPMLAQLFRVTGDGLKPVSKTPVTK